MVNKIYKADEIFHDIEGDPENVNMTIPPEIYEKMGWNPGDTLKITVKDRVISMIKVTDGKE